MIKKKAASRIRLQKHNKMIGKKWILNMDFLRI